MCWFFFIVSHWSGSNRRPGVTGEMTRCWLHACTHSTRCTTVQFIQYSALQYQYSTVADRRNAFALLKSTLVFCQLQSYQNHHASALEGRQLQPDR